MAAYLQVRTMAQWSDCCCLADAAACVRDEINRDGVGSGEWYSSHRHVGTVREVCGLKSRTVAKVSYNGRVWADGPTVAEVDLTVTPCRCGGRP